VASTPVTTQQPKETLYIKNINEKIKSKDIKYAIYWLFESFGQITQIICKKSNKMRGQVFVVFKETNEAAIAKNSLNGFPIFGKPMKI
jgi:U2 small nuclear ribonucleoprotein B''